MWQEKWYSDIPILHFHCLWLYTLDLDDIPLLNSLELIGQQHPHWLNHHRQQQVLPCKAPWAARNSRSATGWWRRRSTWRPHLSVWAQQWMGICVGDLVWTFLKEYPAIEILEIWSAVHRWGNSAAGGPGGQWNQSKAHKSCWKFGRGRIN